MSDNYDPKKSVAKGGVEGINTVVATGVAALIALLGLESIDPELRAALVTVIAGLFAGISKWYRNRAKHK